MQEFCWCCESVTVILYFGWFNSWSFSSECHVLTEWKLALNSLIAFIFNSVEGFGSVFLLLTFILKVPLFKYFKE